MDLPPPVADLCSHFLRIAPEGLVEGLHLRGGLAFGEWRPGRSDVDFVAVLSRRPTDDDVDALRSVHEQMSAYSPIHFDGMHVLATDLASDPRACPDGPTVLGGWFSEGVLDTVVAWHELARCGITVHGRPVSELGVWTSDAVLHDFTRDNLATYWRANADALAKMPDEGGTEDACCWCVLGVVRLDHLLVTGEMTSKSAAGRWALAHYERRWHRVLREALRIRDGGADEYDGNRSERGRDTAAFLAHVVDAAAGDLRR